MAIGAVDTGHSRQTRYGLVGAITVLLVMVRFWTLDEPPSWDAVWTTVSGAQFLADNGFDGNALVDYGYQWFDSAWVRAWSPVTWLDGVIVWLTPSSLDTITALRLGLDTTKLLKRWNIGSLLGAVLIFDLLLKKAPPLFGATGFSPVDVVLGGLSRSDMTDLFRAALGF